jgi:hypothetical protein
MAPAHPGLTEADVIARGGWHPRYARVLAAASDGDYGFAVVDGNGDGAELEAELWMWDEGAWTSGTSSGTGPLDFLASFQAGGEPGEICFAYGWAPGRGSVTISHDGRLHDVPVSRHGVWAFISASPTAGEYPRLVP